MSAPEGSLAAAAAGELERRCATARAKVAAGEMTANAANALLLPWLALACRAGADHPAYAETLAEWRAIGVPASGSGAIGQQGTPFFSEQQVRALVADDIAPLDAIRAALAAALPRAIAGAASPEPERRTRATVFLALAAAFDAPWPALQAAA